MAKIIDTHHPESIYMNVFIDGQPHSLVVQACPEEGWADCLVPLHQLRYGATKVQVGDDGEPVVKRIHGRVEIRYKEK